MNRLGERIDQAIKISGFTKKKIAELVGVHPTNITQYTHNQVVPGIEKLIKIAKVCNVNLIWLITGEGEPDNHNLKVKESGPQYLIKSQEVPPWIKELIDKLLALSPHHRATIEELIDLYYKNDIKDGG